MQMETICMMRSSDLALLNIYSGEKEMEKKNRVGINGYSSRIARPSPKIY